MVAAGFDYYYDNTGMYHAGTVQILAILMEDLPSANMTPDMITSLKDESVASSKAWYNKSILQWELSNSCCYANKWKMAS